MARKPKANGSANGHGTSDMIDEIQEPDDASIEVAAETLTGDIRDFILDRLRHEQNKQAWHLRSESEQRETVHAVDSAVREFATKAIEIIAGAGQRTVKAIIDQVTIKDGIKATLLMSKHDPNRHNLIDATGHTVMVVVADIDEFTGERSEVVIRPDQAEMLAGSMAVHSEPDSVVESVF